MRANNDLMTMRFSILRRILSIIIVMVAVGAAALAQAPGISIRPLMRTTLSDDSTKDVVTLAVEFAPGATTGRHIHPGDEFAALLEGTLEIREEGKEPRRVGGGESYHNRRDVVHETVNVGDAPARLITTFVIDRGKPISIPVKEE